MNDALKVESNRFKKRLQIFLLISILALVLFFLFNILYVGPKYQELVVGFVERDAQAIANNLKINGVNIDYANRKIIPADHFQRAISGYEVQKIKIFDSEGITTYSTDPKDEGIKNTHDYFFSMVANGRPYTKLKHKDDVTLEGEVLSKDIVETYIPIMENGDFIGAFELYLDITERLQKMNSIYLRVLTISLLIVSFIVGVLIFFFVFLRKSISDIYTLQQRVDQSSRFASIGSLATGMAHELNNPLTVIKGYLQSMEKDVANVEHIKKCLVKAIASAERIEQIIKSLQNKSKRAAITEQVPVDMRSILMTSVTQVQDKFREDGIEIWLNVTTGIEYAPFIKGNIFDLEVVLQQLLSNARDALENEEKKQRQIDIALTSSKDLLSVIFQDNGSGMTEVTRERLFDPFFTTKEIGKGAGLGLHVVLKIIREHQGSIDVTSELKKGTTFTLTFPRISN